MKIVSEIFDDFFKKLNEDKTMSKVAIENLRELLMNNHTISPEQVIAIISDMNNDNA